MSRILMLAIAALISSCGSTNECTPEKAHVYAKHCVEQQLRAPASASYSSYPQSKVIQIDSTAFSVRGYVDAQNGFGALIRSQYVAVLRYSNGTWYCESTELL